MASNGASGGSGLTERQIRESEYYDKFVNILDIQDISFDPVGSGKRRPWNPYWYVYELARKLYSGGKDSLLDFGCGCGITSVRFAKIGYEVSGFDISQNSIVIANTLARKYGFEGRIRLTQQVAEKLDYASETFDVIVGFDILHHVNIHAAAAECKRVLKKGGVAIFKEPVESHLLKGIRNTRAVKFFFPNGVNYTPGRHITPDERQLNDEDVAILNKHFPNLRQETFTLFSRFDVLLRRYYGNRPSPLEIFDHVVFRYFPYFKKFGGDAVFVLKKD